MILLQDKKQQKFFKWIKVFLIFSNNITLFGLYLYNCINISAGNQLKPLDIAGARKLQLSTEKTLDQHGANAETSRRRFYSLHETSSGGGGAGGAGGGGSSASGSTKGGVVLEQLVQTEHMDADGQIHLSKKASFKSSDSKSSKRSPLPAVMEAK